MVGLKDALVQVYSGATLIASGLTDANGYYTTKLGAGTFDVYVSKAGYATMHKTVTVTESEELVVNLTQPQMPNLPPYYSGVCGVVGLHATINTIAETSGASTTPSSAEAVSEQAEVSTTPLSAENISENAVVTVT